MDDSQQQRQRQQSVEVPMLAQTYNFDTKRSYSQEYFDTEKTRRISDFQRSQNIGNIQQAIRAVMSDDVYVPQEDRRRVQSSGNPIARNVYDENQHKHKLFYDENTQSILEFDMCGSNHRTFARRGYVEETKKGSMGKETSVYRGMGEEMQINGVRHKNIRKVTSRLQRKETRDGVREVVKEVEHTKITIAGPLSGPFNRGTYRINRIRKYMLELAKANLGPKMEKIKGEHEKFDEDSVLFAENIEEYEARYGHRNQPVFPELPEFPLVIRGWSRGAVGAVEGAMMIKNWLEETYPYYASLVKFQLIQNDPVPGLGSHQTVNSKVELAEKNASGKNRVHTKKDGDKMMMLGDNADVTLTYSMKTAETPGGIGFNPQEVHGAKRVILTPFDHHSNLGSDRMFIDAQTGEEHDANSGFFSLEKGVYMVDENNMLVKMNTYEQARDILERVLGTSKQQDRYDIIDSVCRTWFGRNPPPPPS